MKSKKLLGVGLTKTASKTAVICSNYAWTVYNFRMPLIRSLKSEGYKVIVLTQYDGYEEQIKLEVDEVKSLFISRKGVNPLVDFFTILDLVRYLSRYKPAILLTFTIKPVIYGSIAAKLLNIQSIAMITGLGTAFINQSWITHVVKQLYRISLSSVAIIFFQNSDDRDIFLRHRLVSKNKCRLSPGSGVDTQRFEYVPLTNRCETTFLLVARMLWDKGIREYVEAARIVRAKYPDAKFQLLGPLCSGLLKLDTQLSGNLPLERCVHYEEKTHG